MGNSASKAAKSVAVQASKRQYPTRVPPTSAATTTATTPKAPSGSSSTSEANQGSIVHTQEPASRTKNEAITRDAFDPQLGAALRSIGPVQPSPTQSNSSTAQAWPQFDNGLGGNQQVFPDPRKNPALLVLDARKRLGQEAEAEIDQYGRKGFQGKQFVDVTVIRQMLLMRDQKKMSNKDIEAELELYPGTVSKLSQDVFSSPINLRSKEVRR